MESWEGAWCQYGGLVAIALIFLTWLFIGRRLSPRLWLRSNPIDSARQEPDEARRLQRPDGTELYVEMFGPRDGAIPLILTHGCGADGGEWHYLKIEFASRYRLIVWDLPGMGESRAADNRDCSMEKLANDLNAVLELAEGRPAVLIGHSTGGMVILTFCRLFPERLRNDVTALVLAHTTSVNPALTISPTWLSPHLQKTLLEPLCRLALIAPPVFRLLFKIGYLCGVAHWWIHLQMFAGTETRGQLDYAARYVFKAPVSAIARTNLAMFQFDETQVLGTIVVPTLVVSGDRDVTTVPEASQRIAEGVQNGELIVLSPARHLGIIERNKEFSLALRRFLEQLD